MRRARDPEATRRAIIETAGRLFADRGFSAVTAREVAGDAGVALSAIPYHFGSMDALYREALLLACEVAPEASPLATQALLAEPQAGLRIAVRWALADASAAASNWKSRLLFREELDPTPTYREVLTLKAVPEWNWLCEIVARATGRKAGAPEVKFGVIAMYGLISSFHLQRAMIDHLAPDVAKAVADRRDASIECLATLTADAVAAYAEHLGRGAVARSKARGTKGARRAR